MDQVLVAYKVSGSPIKGLNGIYTEWNNGQMDQGAPVFKRVVGTMTYSLQKYLMKNSNRKQWYIVTAREDAAFEDHDHDWYLHREDAAVPPAQGWDIVDANALRPCNCNRGKELVALKRTAINKPLTVTQAYGPPYTGGPLPSTTRASAAAGDAVPGAARHVMMTPAVPNATIFSIRAPPAAVLCLNAAAAGAGAGAAGSGARDGATARARGANINNLGPLIPDPDKDGSLPSMSDYAPLNRGLYSNGRLLNGHDSDDDEDDDEVGGMDADREDGDANDADAETEGEMDGPLAADEDGDLFLDPSQRPLLQSIGSHGHSTLTHRRGRAGATGRSGPRNRRGRSPGQSDLQPGTSMRERGAGTRSGPAGGSPSRLTGHGFRTSPIGSSQPSRSNGGGADDEDLGIVDDNNGKPRDSGVPRPGGSLTDGSQPSRPSEGVPGGSPPPLMPGDTSRGSGDGAAGASSKRGRPSGADGGQSEGSEMHPLPPHPPAQPQAGSRGSSGIEGRAGSPVPGPSSSGRQRHNAGTNPGQSNVPIYETAYEEDGAGDDADDDASTQGQEGGYREYDGMQDDVEAGMDDYGDARSGFTRDIPQAGTLGAGAHDMDADIEAGSFNDNPSTPARRPRHLAPLDNPDPLQFPRPTIGAGSDPLDANELIDQLTMIAGSEKTREELRTILANNGWNVELAADALFG